MTCEIWFPPQTAKFLWFKENHKTWTAVLIDRKCNANDFCEQLFFFFFFPASVKVPWWCCSWIVVISVKSQVKEFRSMPFFHPSLFHRMTLSPFFLLPLLPNLQSVDLNWKMTWFSSAASSLLHKNQHASSREIWAVCYCLSPPLSLCFCLSISVLLSFSV